MLRFAAAEEFEAWLRSCPLDARNLTFSVSRTGELDPLTVTCTWRTAALAGAAASPAATRSTDSAPAGRPTDAVSHGTDGPHAMADELGGGEKARESGEGGVGSGADGSATEIAELSSRLERMRGLMGVMEQAAPALAMPALGGGGEGGDGGAEGRGGGAPSDGYSQGEAALVAMMRAKEAGASTREQVRACLAARPGGRGFPKPPGFTAVE
jgi:hypothetical protein